MAEFAANNATSSSTSISLFFANYTFHPHMSFGPPRPVVTGSSQYVRDQNQEGREFVTKMEEILQLLCTNLGAAQARQETHANSNRIPYPMYKAGDKV
jgi:hypothetical protein